MTYNGLIRLEDFLSIVKDHRRLKDALNERPAVVVLDGFCVISYEEAVGSRKHAFLQYLYVDEGIEAYYEPVYILRDNSIPNKMYSCSNIECEWCGENSARLTDDYIGSITCSVESCQSTYCISGIDMADVEGIFKDAVIMKKYPRWRWIK